MTIATDIHADLITPLGAYLRLRAEGGASFLLESVEKGRLGRYSLVGSGARFVSFEDAERELAAGRPVVGYLGYDHIAKLEPTVPLPADGPDLPESRFLVADAVVRIDHTSRVAEVQAGDRDSLARRLTKPFEEPRFASKRSEATHRTPSQADYEQRVRAAKDYIRAGDAYQIVLSQRAERKTEVSGLTLYRSLRRINPSPYHFLLELDGLALIGSSPETVPAGKHARRRSKGPLSGRSSTVTSETRWVTCQ
jgi:anthranilate synthase component 1